jgi:predicted nucleic acid-binding protein
VPVARQLRLGTPRVGATRRGARRHRRRLALHAQRELAEIGHHRLAPSDVVIAACAHAAGMRVLHYDSDYDVLAERTSLSFEREWLAPRGTL